MNNLTFSSTWARFLVMLSLGAISCCCILGVQTSKATASDGKGFLTETKLLELRVKLITLKEQLASVRKEEQLLKAWEKVAKGVPLSSEEKRLVGNISSSEGIITSVKKVFDKRTLAMDRQDIQKGIDEIIDLLDADSAYAKISDQVKQSLRRGKITEGVLARAADIVAASAPKKPLKERLISQGRGLLARAGKFLRARRGGGGKLTSVAVFVAGVGAALTATSNADAAERKVNDTLREIVVGGGGGSEGAIKGLVDVVLPTDVVKFKEGDVVGGFWAVVTYGFYSGDESEAQPAERVDRENGIKDSGGMSRGIEYSETSTKHEASDPENDAKQMSSGETVPEVASRELDGAKDGKGIGKEGKGLGDQGAPSTESHVGGEIAGVQGSSDPGFGEEIGPMSEGSGELTDRNGNGDEGDSVGGDRSLMGKDTGSSGVPGGSGGGLGDLSSQDGNSQSTSDGESSIEQSSDAADRGQGDSGSCDASGGCKGPDPFTGTILPNPEDGGDCGKGCSTTLDGRYAQPVYGGYSPVAVIGGLVALISSERGIEVLDLIVDGDVGGGEGPKVDPKGGGGLLGVFESLFAGVLVGKDEGSARSGVLGLVDLVADWGDSTGPSDGGPGGPLEGRDGLVANGDNDDYDGSKPSVGPAPRGRDGGQRTAASRTTTADFRTVKPERETVTTTTQRRTTVQTLTAIAPQPQKLAAPQTPTAKLNTAPTTPTQSQVTKLSNPTDTISQAQNPVSSLSESE